MAINTLINILPRSAWNARTPKRALTPLVNSRLTHIVAHWPGDSRELAGRNSIGLLRAWQAYHMNNRGWNDIGYNYAIDQKGIVWEGRGWNKGGHVLGEQNAVMVGVLFMVGNDEPMSPEMQMSGSYLFQWIDNRAGGKLKRSGHCDWANKLCPGPFVLSWLRRGAGIPKHTIPLSTVVPTKRGETAAAPAFPLPRGSYFGPREGGPESVSGYHGHRADLDKWQTRMAYRGWKITPDGLYGPETRRVAKAFQTEKWLGVDGLIGPETWRAAWEAKID